MAQFCHDPQRLDLGGDGRVLFVFSCDRDPGCANWDAFKGATAVFVVEPGALSTSPTPAPRDTPSLRREVIIARWVTRDDGVPTELAAAFYSDDAYLELDDNILDKVTACTRLGGLPAWAQSAQDVPGPNWGFVGQIDIFHTFLTPPKAPPAWVEPWQGDEGFTHIGGFTEFGDGGMAYLFRESHRLTPHFVLFTQSH